MKPTAASKVITIDNTNGKLRKTDKVNQKIINSAWRYTVLSNPKVVLFRIF